MAQLSKRDAAGIVELERLLADLTHSPDDRDVSTQIAELLGVDATSNIRFDYDDDRLVVAQAASAGPMRVSTRDLERLKRGIASGHMQFLFSSPVPEGPQRNRLVEFSSIRAGKRVQGRQAAKLGFSNDALRTVRPGLESLITLYEEIGIAHMHNARILVCDGPLLLRYVSMVADRPFTNHQRALLVRCTHALRRRTLLEHHLGVHATYQLAFAVALEAMGRAAFLVDARGRILHANQLGRSALDSDTALAAELGHAIRGESHGFDVHCAEHRGMARSYIVVRRRADLAQVAAAFAMEHGFTGRGGDVFVAAASGESTKHIAARLGVAANTVEYHLTRVFRAVGVSSRAELQRLLTERLLGNAEAALTAARATWRRRRS